MLVRFDIGFQMPSWLILACFRYLIEAQAVGLHQALTADLVNLLVWVQCYLGSFMTTFETWTY